MPLMLSDLVAATYSMVRHYQGNDTREGRSIVKRSSAKNGVITFLELAPNALLELKERYEADRQAKIASWRSSKPAV